MPHFGRKVAYRITRRSWYPKGETPGFDCQVSPETDHRHSLVTISSGTHRWSPFHSTWKCYSCEESLSLGQHSRTTSGCSGSSFHAEAKLLLLADGLENKVSQLVRSNPSAFRLNGKTETILLIDCAGAIIGELKPTRGQAEALFS